MDYEYVSPPGWGLTLRTIPMPPGGGPMGGFNPSEHLCMQLGMPPAVLTPIASPIAQQEPETQTVVTPGRRKRPLVGFAPSTV